MCLPSAESDSQTSDSEEPATNYVYIVCFDTRYI